MLWQLLDLGRLEETLREAGTLEYQGTSEFVKKKISNDQELIQSDPTSCP